MEVVNLFKALADETRLRLMNLLINHELSVNEIVTVMDMGQSRISRHLKILTDSGLLKSRRDGLWIFYSVETEGIGSELTGLIKEFLGRDPDLYSDYNKLRSKLQKGLDKKARFFDSIASNWDSIKSEIFGEFNISQEIISGIEKCNIAADLGCGNGDLLYYIKKKAAKVIGVDKSPKMLEQARSRLTNNGKNIELRIGEIEHLPMRDNEVDAAVINMVLHHLPSPGEGISEAGRVIKQGGSLIIADLEKHRNEEMRMRYEHRWLGFHSKSIEKWLEKSGFTLINLKKIEVRQGLVIDLYSAKKS